MTAFFVFIAFLIVCSIVLEKCVSGGGLGKPVIFTAYLFKVLLGCLYGFIFITYYNGDDTWILNKGIEDQYKLLATFPGQFFHEPFANKSFFHTPDPGFLINLQYYLVDLERWLVTKPLALFYPLTKGNYYINIILFNFISFFGQYWIFLLLSRQWPQRRRIIILFVFFFSPGIFWLSGLRTDGLLLLFSSLSLYKTSCLLKKITLSGVAGFIAGLAGTFIVRPQVCLLLVPAIAVWWLSTKYRIRPLKAFGIIMSLLCMLVIIGAVASPHTNIFRIIAEKQHAFLNLHGTSFALNPLDGTFSNFLKILPQALLNVFLRPTLWEWKGALQLFAAFETFVFLALILVLIVRPSRHTSDLIKLPFLVCILFFCITLYVIIGLTVPFPGAIVRYKAIPELWLLSIAASTIQWKK